MSDYSLEEYLTIKHVMSGITGLADKGWHRTIFTKRYAGRRGLPGRGSVR